MANLRERYRYLPHPYPILLEKAGEAFMLRVVRVLGGGSYPIPAHPWSRSAVLVEKLGEDDAATLTRILTPLGYLNIAFPRAFQLRVRIRDLRVLRLRSEGMSPRVIAERENITERTVYGILQRCRDEGLTPDMSVVELSPASGGDMERPSEPHQMAVVPPSPPEDPSTGEPL